VLQNYLSTVHSDGYYEDPDYVAKIEGPVDKKVTRRVGTQRIVDAISSVL
jgi:hypothetical protein